MHIGEGYYCRKLIVLFALVVDHYFISFAVLEAHVIGRIFHIAKTSVSKKEIFHGRNQVSCKRLPLLSFRHLLSTDSGVIHRGRPCIISTFKTPQLPQYL